MARFGRILILLSFVLTATVIFLILRNDGGPRYAGRSLTEWVDLYQSVDEDAQAQQAQEVRTAIRHIAADHLPLLTSWIAYDPTTRRQKTTAWAKRLPKPLRQSSIMRPLLLDQDEFRANAATTALCVLGPEASPALPELTRLMNQTHTRQVSRRALWVLGHMGAVGLQPLMSVINDPQHPNRMFAIDYLTDLGTNALPAVPALTKCLEDPDPAVRLRATNALARLVPGSLSSTH
ncbi:MAG TPA: HEAT repeat domain-containing protein [Clostridia bacterium]|nr:HEAT repeat domain-containing protein [Clostridia bacterium]